MFLPHSLSDLDQGVGGCTHLQQSVVCFPLDPWESLAHSLEANPISSRDQQQDFYRELMTKCRFLLPSCVGGFRASSHTLRSSLKSWLCSSHPLHTLCWRQNGPIVLSLFREAGHLLKFSSPRYPSTYLSHSLHPLLFFPSRAVFSPGHGHFYRCVCYFLPFWNLCIIFSSPRKPEYYTPFLRLHAGCPIRLSQTFALFSLILDQSVMTGPRCYFISSIIARNVPSFLELQQTIGKQWSQIGRNQPCSLMTLWSRAR